MGRYRKGDAASAGGYPTANTVAYRADFAAMDPGYTKGLNPLDSK